MNFDQPHQKSLDEVRAIVEELGAESVTSHFQEAALEIARQQRRLEQEMTSFNQTRQQWESERQRSVVDIEEQSKQLADAWLKLERERRTQRLAGPVSEERANEKQRAQIAETARTSPTPSADDRQSQTTIPRNPNSPSLIQQFQLLQRESQRG